MMQKATTRKTRVVYPISLGAEDNKLLEKLSERTGTSKAQAIRDAIRAYSDEVQGLEVVKLREVPKQQARKEILDYLKVHDRALTSDIADELKLDIVFVNEILEKLWSEDRVEQRTPAKSD